MILKGRVQDGRLLLNERTELPEGTEVDLLLLETVNPSDRVALHQALAASQSDIEAGRLFDAEAVLGELRARFGSSDS